MEHQLTVYEKQTAKRLQQWERSLLKSPGMLESASRSVQQRINRAIPEKVHESVTAAVKSIFQTALFSLDYLPKNAPLRNTSLALRDARAEELISLYKKIAAAEGAGTGAGGILLGIADFPLLIGIKMKFLFELAHVYGHDTRDYRERLFILQLFQLAFSSQDKKAALLNTISNWHLTSDTLPPADTYARHIDWRQLQQEYRDTIDFRKLLQLLPGIGAVIGAWANYGLLDELGTTGMNGYRIRWLNEEPAKRKHEPKQTFKGWGKPETATADSDGKDTPGVQEAQDSKPASLGENLH